MVDSKLTGKPVTGCMKTTIDLPDALVKEIKLRALYDGQKLKDAVAELLRKGLAAPTGPADDEADDGPGYTLILRRGCQLSTPLGALTLRKR